ATPVSSVSCSRSPRDLRSFPTRRSSDLCTFGRRISRSSSSERIGVSVSRLIRMSAISALSYPNELALPLKFFSKSEILDLSASRSEEHTSELQSRFDLVCRLLLEKKKEN